ncbi:MAG TPA: hypothetical protein VFV48_02440, partial [Pseudomonadales bacterium]|nr:hypothetical protein [Pseudomonadales bacterium]
MIKLFNQYIRVPFLVLAVVEFLAAIVAVCLGYSLRSSLSSLDDSPLSAATVLVIGASLLLSMFAMGLYQSRLREGFEGIVVRLIVSYGFAIILVSLLFYLFPSLHVGRGIVAMALLVSFFAM